MDPCWEFIRQWPPRQVSGTRKWAPDNIILLMDGFNHSPVCIIQFPCLCPDQSWPRILACNTLLMNRHIDNLLSCPNLTHAESISKIGLLYLFTVHLSLSLRKVFNLLINTCSKTFSSPNLKIVNRNNIFLMRIYVDTLTPSSVNNSALRPIHDHNWSSLALYLGPT